MRCRIRNTPLSHIFFSLALLLPAQAMATKPMVAYSVHGCVFKGQFVPYSGQVVETPRRVPLWVRKTGGRNLEGKAIVIGWNGYMSARKGIPSFLIRRDGGWWKIAGACESERLPAPPEAAR